MKKLILFLLLSTSCAPSSNAEETRRFYCKTQGTNNQGLSAWDTLIRYTIDKNKNYNASFPKRKPPHTTKLVNNVLSLSSVLLKRKQQGFYRETFESYRLNLDNLLLIHSYFYYVDQEDFNKNFSNLKKYNNSELFYMIDLQERPNYKKLAWDKTTWQCEEISFSRWLSLSFTLFLYAVGSAG